MTSLKLAIDEVMCAWLGITRTPHTCTMGTWDDIIADKAWGEDWPTRSLGLVDGKLGTNHTAVLLPASLSLVTDSASGSSDGWVGIGLLSDQKPRIGMDEKWLAWYITSTDDVRRRATILGSLQDN